MAISTQLFKGNLICLGPINHEKDPDIESRWTHDPAYLQMLGPQIARPLSVAQVKKKYESIEKEADENHNSFYFTIRLISTDPTENDRLIGFAKIDWIEWNHGAGRIELGIAEEKDRRHGYGSETLGLLLRFAFDELNLHSLYAFIPKYNLVALELFRRTGFTESVRQREAIQRNGRRWDLIYVGILQEEWEAVR